MKRSSYLRPLLAVPAIALFLVAISGCPSGGKKDGTPPKADGTGVPVSKEVTEKKGGKTEAISAKLESTVKGKVVYDGTPPAMAEINMKGHEDAPKCKAGPHNEQTWIIGKDNGVANVVVYLEPTAGKSFAVDDKLTEKAKQDAAIDQPYCVYEPHVIAMFPAYRNADGKLHETGQKLRVKNSGGISHNTKITGDERAGNSPWSKNVNPDTKEGEIVPVKYQKKPLDVACDKHTWMNAKILTFDHPYFAVTDNDGNFEIANVPTDVELTVKVWHESGKTPDEKKSFQKGDNNLSLKIK